MPVPDRPSTDEEKAKLQKAKLRDYQVAEILRRRNGDGPAAIAEADAPAGPARPRACPRCGKPYGKRVRCYRCKPANPAGDNGRRTPRAARPGPGPEGVPASLEEPSLPKYVPSPPLAVIDVAGDFTPPPPDIPRGAPSIIIGAAPPVADALEALRAVCEMLAPLSDGDARWVLEAANLYRCRR